MRVMRQKNSSFLSTCSKNHQAHSDPGMQCTVFIHWWMAWKGVSRPWKGPHCSEGFRLQHIHKGCSQLYTLYTINYKLDLCSTHYRLYTTFFFCLKTECKKRFRKYTNIKCVHLLLLLLLFHITAGFSNLAGEMMCIIPV